MHKLVLTTILCSVFFFEKGVFDLKRENGNKYTLFADQNVKFKKLQFQIIVQIVKENWFCSLRCHFEI